MEMAVEIYSRSILDCLHYVLTTALCDSSNTYRIFDRNVPDRLNPDEVYRDHKYATRDPDEAELLKTHNIPQPYNIKFIRTNVRFLNEPIAHIEMQNPKAEQVDVQILFDCFEICETE